MFERRARPLLGTIVEVGARGGVGLEAAFAALAEVEAALSRFDEGSEVARFNRLPRGGVFEVGADAAAVLEAAQALHAASGGRFDVALGSGRWRLAGRMLVKLDAATRLDLGGIAKGHAVDRAVEAMRGAGCAAGHVNAGGDLRTFGDEGLWLQLRDERGGGVRTLGRLHDGACATSRYAPGSRCRLAGAAGHEERHVSVLAERCLWADALTKFAALGLALPTQFGATALIH